MYTDANSCVRVNNSFSGKLNALKDSGRFQRLYENSFTTTDVPYRFIENALMCVEGFVKIRTTDVVDVSEMLDP